MDNQEDRLQVITEPVQRSWRFIQESWVELKKVHWPSRQETQATTRVVMIVVVVVAVYLGTVDWALSKMVQFLFGVE